MFPVDSSTKCDFQVILLVCQMLWHLPDGFGASFDAFFATFQAKIVNILSHCFATENFQVNCGHQVSIANVIH